MFFLILGILIGTLAFLLVSVLVVGRFLPEEYLSKVQHASAQSPDAIYPLLLDPRAVSYGGKQVRSITVLSEEGELLKWREDLGPSKFTSGVVELDENSRVVVEGIDSVVNMTMRREITLTPNGSGTTVAINQRILIENGTWHVPIFRIMMRLGAANAGVKDYLRRLANKLGENSNLSEN